MANYLRTKLHFLIGLAGFLVFCFGIFILASGIKIRNILTGELKVHRGFGSNTCQYWAGIPTILTGGVLVQTARLNKRHSLKYISLCCVMITMVLALGVIIIEGFDATIIHRFLKEDSWCEVTKQEHKYRLDCAILKEAYPWYFMLVFITVIVLVLCSFVKLLLFTDWILFVAPEMLQDQQASREVPPPQQERYVAAPTEQYQRTWNSQYGQSTIPFHPM
ncbi:Hypothetical predicted protein [Paramuricea clavata]|uniref:Uncharacterized protein n=1 Tax=Paramuricea clavata TaxID=317549 RepID=A0A6S7H0N2_PARCT|nr:Hypothetical predicted protein [Paramuricea clavata]